MNFVNNFFYQILIFYLKIFHSMIYFNDRYNPHCYNQNKFIYQECKRYISINVNDKLNILLYFYLIIYHIELTLNLINIFQTKLFKTIFPLYNIKQMEHLFYIKFYLTSSIKQLQKCDCELPHAHIIGENE